MNYSIDGERILLGKGDCLFVNAKHLHYGYDSRRQECLFTCTLIHPSLLSSNAKIFQEFVEPIIRCEALPYLHLKEGSAGYDLFVKTLDQVWMLKQYQQDAYQMNAIGYLMQIIPMLLKRAGELDSSENLIKKDPKLYSQKQMVAYISQNYASDISLEDIASSANVSVSTCCRIFKAYIHQSPVEFLNAYRLRVSCNLLEDTDKSITEIATLCGFNHISYFSEIFLKNYQCTPTQYRKMNRR